MEAKAKAEAFEDRAMLKQQRARAGDSNATYHWQQQSTKFSLSRAQTQHTFVYKWEPQFLYAAIGMALQSFSGGELKHCEAPSSSSSLTNEPIEREREREKRLSDRAFSSGH